MGRSRQNAGFVCARCRRRVEPLTNGSYRNHCPHCLWSRHVDVVPGDRACACRGLMEPVAAQRSGRGMRVVHRCCACGAVRVNRAAEMTAQPDDVEVLIELLYAPADPGGQSGGSILRRLRP